MGAADGACVGLGVEAAVEGVVVLGLAGGTHGEDGHGGLRPVVGDAASDGEARTAVGAVEEGITVAAVGGIEELAETVGTGGGIGRNAGGNLAFDFAGDDAESPIASWRQVANGDGVDAGEGRNFDAEAVQECFDACGRAFNLDQDAFGVVSDGAGEGFFCSEAVDEGAKAHALDNAADAHGDAAHIVRLSGWGGVGQEVKDRVCGAGVL